MKIKSFEAYLEEKFIEGDGSMVLDDGLSDAFDGWLQNLDVDEWLKFGDEYGELRDMKAHEA